MEIKRLFVALWPPTAIQHELAALTNDPYGVSVATKNLHLTLAFLGNSSIAQEACYRQALAKLRFSPIALDIARFGFWREPRVLWAGPRETPPALVELVEDLHALLRPCGFVPEPRPFRTHITLKRKYPGPAPDWDARSQIHWRADTVALVWSQSTPHGVHYQPLLQMSAVKTSPT